MDVKISGMSFERGIERIITAGETPQGELPKDGRLAPSERRTMPRLDQLLHTPTLADALGAELAPRLEDRDVLLPDCFHRTLGEIQDSLAGEAARHPAQAALFTATAALLREEREMRDLLDMYRNALLKG